MLQMRCARAMGVARTASWRPSFALPAWRGAASRHVETLVFLLSESEQGCLTQELTGRSLAAGARGNAKR
ncbi:hypothetical protein SD72_13345 [Leucobacter komagatae]|uniref:Uncharacterized protein n=1 Tax=Leucobacter komagatae TaxID=55969 RepID=A0A0D0IQI4_9MICO|nr:hypothetical protein SD72_13345 [Leucobacter komagatae]